MDLLMRPATPGSFLAVFRVTMLTHTSGTTCRSAKYVASMIPATTVPRFITLRGHVAHVPADAAGAALRAVYRSQNIQLPA